MEDYNELMRRRAEKAAELRANDINPYANDFRVSHTVAEVLGVAEHLDEDELAARESEQYAVAGRVIALRSFGKAAFVKIRDRSGDFQMMVRRDVIGVDDFKGVFKKVDVGDIVGAQGHLFRTKTGELTIQAQSFRLLTKALRPLPEKWHGLTDKETRFRQRYVDLIANPDVRRIFQVRAAAIRHIRKYFDDRDFLEVETPMMHTVAGGAAARPFETFHNALGIPLYLRIAPELFLKRLVVGGLERVYEINRNFRNEGLSQKHNPEFTMLEFYQAFATFEDLMDLTEDLITGLVEKLTGGTVVEWGDKTIDFKRPWRRLRITEALVQLGGLSEEDALDASALTKVLKKAGMEPDEGTPLGKLQMEAFELLCEDKLDQPTFATHFPIEVSPLSRKNDEEPHLVDRFEFYVGGMEFGNAFSELNDPVDQRERFEGQMEQKAQGDDEAHEMDADYVRALEYGLPPTAGEGIGIDRLVMMLTNSASIREVILFPHMRPLATTGTKNVEGEEEDASS